jgi:branched-chain amino acid transport system substrate-binding protein
LRKLISAATLILAVTAGAAHAQENIKIGLIMPLTGNSASAGQQAKAAVELAAEIVNGAYPEFATLPLASSVGLPNLKGAKLKIIAADNQNNPSTGQKQTVRLITEEQVVALQGAYLSVTLAATAIAEQYGIPWMVGESVAVNITKRGFKWTFRVTPNATDYARSYMEFLSDLKQAGHQIGSNRRSL